jgi:uncharacterized protein VirK/YbjX
MSADDIDYLFVRLSADQLARAIIGDVRFVPSAEQRAHAQQIIDRTGTLYRMAAGFKIDEWRRTGSSHDDERTT